MATKRASSAVQKNAAGQQRESLFASRSRLLARIGPPVFEAIAGDAGLVLLMRRIDLLGLARHGHWPKPLVSQVNSLILKGSEAVREVQSAADYVDLCYRIVLECAVVPPPALEALGGPPARSEYAGNDGAFASDLADFKRRKGEVLAGISRSELRPLFVQAGDEPHDDQLVLVPPGSESAANLEPGEMMMTFGDLSSLATQAMNAQVGALAIFRDQS